MSLRLKTKIKRLDSEGFISRPLYECLKLQSFLGEWGFNGGIAISQPSLKTIFTDVLKMNESLMGLERLESE